MDISFKLSGSLFNYRVAGVLVQNNHVLVGDTIWALPGGRVKTMEDARTALKREIFEELDMSVSIGALYIINENFFSYKNTVVHEIGLYFAVDVEDAFKYTEGDFHGPEDERLIYRWIPLEQLNNVFLQSDFLCDQLQHLPEQPLHIVTTK